MNAGCIVVCLGAPVSRTIQRLAKEHHCTVISTPLDTYAVARLINQSMPVDYFMKKEKLVTFHRNDYTEQIREIMSSKRYRDFPILDKEDRYIGMISRRNLLGVRKRGLILVDHNELSQAIDNVEDAEILEIIDHHRIGSLETMNPVYFRNQPVGCTGTIVCQLFRENNVEIPPHIAGLLCSAILSDTLMFRSPTCTFFDEEAARMLAKIAGIECEDLAADMFTAGANLSGKTDEEIFYQDYKTFEYGDSKLGIAQINSMSGKELVKIRERMMPYLSKAAAHLGLDILLFMLTDILDESTDVICFGETATKLTQDAFPGVQVVDHMAHLPGVVSRKKQIVPALMKAVNQASEMV